MKLLRTQVDLQINGIKKFFESVPVEANDNFAVATISPVVHYCMGGVAGNEHAEVLDKNGKPIPGLYVTGEALGGVHGTNRLGGSSLLDCVVYGRISGQSSTKYLLENLIKSGGAGLGGAGNSLNVGGITASVNVVPNSNKISLDFSWGQAGKQQLAASQTSAQNEGAAGFQEEDPNAAFYGSGFKSGAGESGKGDDKKKGGKEMKTYSMDEVAKHTSKDDCWVVLHGDVYALENFLDEHPGGAKAILLYAGKDATEAFDMLHSADIIERYAREYQVGTLADAPKSKL